MNMLSALRDSWYFFSHNLAAIARLCLPLIVLEGLLLQQVTNLVAAESATLWRLLAGLLFYPLYSAALILFLDARSQGLQPRARDLLAASLRLWPSFALLAGLNTLVILLGASLFVLPGIWLMVKLAFAEYLLVLRGLSPMKALHESFQLSSGYFWPMLGCILIVMLPLWLLDGWSHSNEVLADNALTSLLLDCASRFLQLFSSVVLFRLFMLRSAQPEVE
ncbi:YciC family protein [Pseudomonas sp. SG20056]|uniref:YciC family protein n=1 Tax=Pseudomonas sp. SG20056 TaxID=3074146 RepID=UPI00287FE496|nr:YciC family protein [Pseudomonas sp. SG20056]WNF46085.1 YciC family protein [Pseudomonas sp. SG20056]